MSQESADKSIGAFAAEIELAIELNEELDIDLQCLLPGSLVWAKTFGFLLELELFDCCLSFSLRFAMRAVAFSRPRFLFHKEGLLM